MNYDELDIPAYDDSKDSDKDKNKAYDSGDIGKLKDDTCVGNDCCPDNYTYKPAENKCSQPFTTLEYEQVESAYTDKSFNSEDLKRAPNAQNVAPLKEVTSLNYSTF